MNKYVLSILVDNNANVLARVSSLFARRRFNMSSVTAAKTENPAISNIIIVTEGDENALNQVIQQSLKLQEVKKVTRLLPNESLFSETLIIKIALDGETISDIRNIVEIYGARIVDLAFNSLIIQLTGNPSKLDAFLEVLKPYRIVEMCRSGVVGMIKGSQSDWWNCDSKS